MGRSIRQVVALTHDNIVFVQFATKDRCLEATEKCEICDDPAIDTRPSDGAYHFCSEVCRWEYFMRLSS